MRVSAVLCSLVAALAVLAGAHAETSGSAATPAGAAGLGSGPAGMLLAKFTVSDLPRSYDFYTRVIGLKPATRRGMPPPPAPTHADEAARDFIEIPLNYSGRLDEPFFVLVHQRGLKPSPENARLAWVGFSVLDVRAVVARVRAVGQEIVREPFNVGGSDIVVAIVRDPDGYTVEFLQSGVPAGGS